MRQARRPRAVSLVMLIAIFVLGVAVGCGDEEAPAEGVAASHERAVSELGALPKPTGAVPVGEPEVKGRVATQSFTVPGLEAKDVIGFYQVKLPSLSWAPQGARAEVHEGWQAVWIRDERELTITGHDEDPGKRTSRLEFVLVQPPKGTRS